MKKPALKRSIRLPADLARQLADHAASRRVAQSAVIEAALASHLSPDGPERLEAAFARRLDRIGRQLDRLQWHVELSNETLALFIRFWLTTTPPLSEAALKASQASGKERWERFIETLNRRLELGPRFRDDVALDKNVEHPKR
ncbi:CopG family transcriptional regulator [Novosphingobium pokkalii]|uniref:CopG family transcriptional regulator n=1 Tax=Novosphingobium pokkalii TaxID=1770194 RepID=A0ABV7UYA0_9SPHN|nr:CopG family transcriptional regulator [Novosphingobium pokkalii]GHC97065.1 CopG family transcriptional regulator [Novosphingobium pokkalii]